MKSNPFARGVNVAQLGPVADPFCGRGTTGPDACSPTCPTCGGEALWFTDPRAARAELVCLDCVPAGSTTDPTDAGGTGGGLLTAERLKRHARAYADEHFPGWHGITVRIRMGERDGRGGELLLVLTNSA